MPVNDEKGWADYAKGVKRLRGKPSTAPKIKRKGVPSPLRPAFAKASAGLGTEVRRSLGVGGGGLGRGASQSAETYESVQLHPSRSPPHLTSPARGEESVLAKSKGRSVKTVSLDKRVERQMRNGDIEIEARLDLHGLTQEKAHAALTRFIEAQSAQGRRRLLVITGRGRGGESILRANFPRWCAAPSLAEHILALRPAAPKHGGAGAWYVILKRQHGDKVNETRNG